MYEELTKHMNKDYQIKYMTMCGDVKTKLIPVTNMNDAEMSFTAYKEVQKLATDTFGLLDCIIEKDGMGKPFFKKHINYDLSISHTEGLVVVAVGKKHKIGIDVEKIHKVSDRIIEKYYSKAEKKAILQTQANTEIVETKIWTMKEAYESFCYQNCQRIILEYVYGSQAVLFINTVPTIEIEVGDKLRLREKKNFRSLLPSLNKYINRFYYKDDESAEDIFKRNIKFVYENKTPIIVGTDTYFLPYSDNYKKKHAKHTLILCGFDLTRDVVYVIDWYSPWFYKGEVDIETFLNARNSKNEKDGTFYSGSPIENNWAYVEKIPHYSADKLFDETIRLSKEFYFNNSDNGVISVLSLWNI